MANDGIWRKAKIPRYKHTIAAYVLEKHSTAQSFNNTAKTQHN